MKENASKREGLGMGRYRTDKHHLLPQNIKWIEEGYWAISLGVPIGNDLDSHKWWGGVFLISRSVAGPGLERLRASHENKKQKTRGGARGPGLRGPSGLVPRVGPRGGRWWAGRPVGWSTGRVGRVGRWSDGMVALLLG